MTFLSVVNKRLQRIIGNSMSPFISRDVTVLVLITTSYRTKPREAAITNAFFL